MPLVGPARGASDDTAMLATYSNASAPGTPGAVAAVESSAAVERDGERDRARPDAAVGLVVVVKRRAAEAAEQLVQVARARRALWERRERRLAPSPAPAI